MGQLPIFFRKSGDVPLLTADASELATSLGITTLYFGDSDGPSYFLTRNAFYSKIGYDTIDSTNNVLKNYNLSIKAPFQVEGQCVINIPIVITNTTGGARSPSRSWYARLGSTNNPVTTTYGSSQTDSPTAPSGSSGGQTNYNGYTVVPNINLKLVSVVLGSGYTQTTAYVYESDGSTLKATATFSGDTATFSSDVLLSAGTTYYIVVSSGGASYTGATGGGSTGTTGRFNFTDKVYGSPGSWSGAASQENIKSLITTIPTALSGGLGGSSATISHTNQATATSQTKNICFPFDVTRTKILAGETLYVRIFAGADSAAGGSSLQTFYGTDPANRTVLSTLPYNRSILFLSTKI